MYKNTISNHSWININDPEVTNHENDDEFDGERDNYLECDYQEED